MTDLLRPLTGKMSDEERAMLVAAIEHDARQLQHSTEMGLRALRLITTDLSARRFEDANFDHILWRMTAELSSVQVAIRQVMAAEQDLVDAIRLEFDQTRPTVRVIRADVLMDHASKSNRSLAGDVSVRVAASRLTLLSDERWVQRILNNLIANALWHSDGSKIFVGARRRGEDIVFEVRDNGRGMTADEVAGVFNPIKAPPLSPVSHPAARSGLGLYSARLFASRLGGSVDCNSAPGRGSLFRVRLPGPVGLAERQPRTCGVEAARVARNKMVAVLDEDLSVLRTAERVFGSFGVEVYADHDPLRWLNVVTDLKRMPDLFLVGYQLRGQDCSAQIDVVRRKWREQRPKVIVLTGNAGNGQVLRASAQAPVLRKPLSEGDLIWLLGILADERELPKAGIVCR
jgi:CheY-like chemotaxis protein/two-component sensor histidine kinase